MQINVKIRAPEALVHRTRSGLTWELEEEASSCFHPAWLSCPRAPFKQKETVTTEESDLPKVTKQDSGKGVQPGQHSSTFLTAVLAIRLQAWD